MAMAVIYKGTVLYEQDYVGLTRRITGYDIPRLLDHVYGLRLVRQAMMLIL
jgi:hypothetical protein